MQRLAEQFSLHPLTGDERVTCESMLSQEPSSRVLVMPTHHINELGDMMGFRWAFSLNTSDTSTLLKTSRQTFNLMQEMQVLMQPICGGELPASGEDNVSRAHAGGVPAGE